MLNHVNTDIAVDVFEVLSELTDPEVLGEAEEAEAFVKARATAGRLFVWCLVDWLDGGLDGQVAGLLGC